VKIKSLFTTLFSIFFILTASNSFAQITLKASHQFPGGKGDGDLMFDNVFPTIFFYSSRSRLCSAVF